MTTKVNGYVIPGESVSKDMQFYTVTTAIDIRALSAGGDAASQARLDKLVEVISLNGQPVILGAPVANGGNYDMRFVIEHAGSWASTVALVDAIVANTPAAMGFTAANTSVVISQTI